ncbi:MAG: siphovirus Gp157 family protein [Treponema sp.]|nr:siphovirus Gp157 family protein [Candidatus Treponema merdequi]
MKLYEITGEALAIQDLIETAVDENGEPRELTTEEDGIITQFFLANQEHFEEKADAYGKVMANLQMMADEAENERKTYKAELDRLSARAKTFTNRKDNLKKRLFWAMDLLKKDKIKTALFSFNIQNKPMSINTDLANISAVPDCFLKKEVSKSAISSAIKAGEITVTDSGSLIYNKTGELLEGIKAEKEKTLVIR